MTQRSTARYISQKPRAGHRSDGKKELLTDLRSSSRAHGGIHFAPIWHRTVAFVFTLLTFCGASEVNVQRSTPGILRCIGGHTHLATGSRTSGKTQVHKVPGDGHIPERVQPFTSIGLVCLGFQAGQGRRNRQCQPRCVRMKYAKMEGGWNTRSIQDMMVRKRKHKVRRRCLQ